MLDFIIRAFKKRLSGLNKGPWYVYRCKIGFFHAIIVEVFITKSDGILLNSLFPDATYASFYVMQ